MHRSSSLFLCLVVFALVSLITPADSLAISTSVRLFNVAPTTLYSVARNGVQAGDAASTEDGVATFDLNTSPGDRFEFALDGSLQPPAPPVFTTLVTRAPGCAHAAWLPSGDPTVVGYVVGYGGRSGAGGQLTPYEFTVDVGAATYFDVCRLQAGTYYFSVRAKNYLGMLSAYSPEQTVVIIVVAVLINRFDATARADGVYLSWDVFSDEAVRGYRVYRYQADGAPVPVNDALLPVGAESFVDRTVAAAQTYSYLLSVLKENGDEVRSIVATVTTPALAFSPEQNVPNPFNPATHIAFTLEEPSRVWARVYDVHGALVATLYSGRLDAGRHDVEWTGRNGAGERVASGAYFYAVTAGKRTLSRKMVLLK